MYSFDRTSFEAFKAEDRRSDYGFWSEKSQLERLKAAYYLISVAYDFDPDDPPRMDKTVFQARKRDW